jgi:hypothetical protein
MNEDQVRSLRERQRLVRLEDNNREERERERRTQEEIDATSAHCRLSHNVTPYPHLRHLQKLLLLPLPLGIPSLSPYLRTVNLFLPSILEVHLSLHEDWLSIWQGLLVRYFEMCTLASPDYALAELRRQARVRSTVPVPTTSGNSLKRVTRSSGYAHIANFARTYIVYFPNI